MGEINKMATTPHNVTTQGMMMMEIYILSTKDAALFSQGRGELSGIFKCPPPPPNVTYLYMAFNSAGQSLNFEPLD